MFYSKRKGELNDLCDPCVTSLLQESMELQHKQSRPVAVTCMAFPHGDVNNFIVGSEEGAVFTGGARQTHRQRHRLVPLPVIVIYYNFIT